MAKKPDSPNITFTRPELDGLKKQYTLIRDALSGSVAVKEAGSLYLPRPDATDLSRENKARYEAYKERAVYVNITRRTLDGLIGQVFMRPPVINTPSVLKSVVSNATGNGVSLELLAKRVLGYTLAYSRAGIFVDYPNTGEDSVTSIADMESGRIRPTINATGPMSVINWRTRNVGAEEILSLVVISEDYAAQDDGFEVKYNEQWRVLGLDAEGDYYQEIWRESSKKARTMRQEYERVDLFYPRDAANNYMKFIPFTFVGSENNDANPDNPGFYGLASLNIAHYRNYADLEESAYQGGQPTLVLTGIDDQWRKDSGGIARMGSVGGIGLPLGGDAKLLQAAPNNLVLTVLQLKEKQMAAIGARFIEERSVQRTATEASLDSFTESSILSSTSRNVSEAMQNALKWAAGYMGVNPDLVEFKLNTDFDLGRMSAEDRRQLVEEWQKGAITLSEMRTVLTRGGIATENIEDARAQLLAETEVDVFKDNAS